MAKTLIDINEEYLDAAQQALGTATKKDTVNAARSRRWQPGAGTWKDLRPAASEILKTRK
jgi:Arc/MetJ family transcription regulator